MNNTRQNMKILQYAEKNIQMYLNSNNMKGNQLMTNDKKMKPKLERIVRFT